MSNLTRSRRCQVWITFIRKCTLPAITQWLSQSACLITHWHYGEIFVRNILNILFASYRNLDKLCKTSVVVLCMLVCSSLIGLFLDTTLLVIFIRFCFKGPLLCWDSKQKVGKDSPLIWHYVTELIIIRIAEGLLSTSTLEWIMHWEHLGILIFIL